MDMKSPEDFDMQLIGSFLSCASKGDRVGLNQMLIDSTSPDVKDYDNRTALHLAASEGQASIVELLILHGANVNPMDRWQRTVELYGHRDICRILEVNGGKDSTTDNYMTFSLEPVLNEVNIDLSELSLEQQSVDQGFSGESKKVKWRGTWVVKTTIRPRISNPQVILPAKELTLLRELRHPNIVQFLGATVERDEMILITEFLSGMKSINEIKAVINVKNKHRNPSSGKDGALVPQGSLADILSRRIRFDITTSVRYALDIARGMNYLHYHKPHPIIHSNLCTRNLLQDEGGHLKISEYWVQMLYEQIDPFQHKCQRNENSHYICSSPYDTTTDIEAFAEILYEVQISRFTFLDSLQKYHTLCFILLELDLADSKLHVITNAFWSVQMLEGRSLSDRDADMNSTSNNNEPKFKLSRCPIRIQQ
ncbi:hypothetical protein ACLOJK_032905 [Asimina triloba]